MRHKNLLMCYFSPENSVNPTPVQYYSYSLPLWNLKVSLFI
jgi:hypothetical protein